MLAGSAMHICHGNICGTRLTRSARVQRRRGHMAPFRRSGAPTTSITTRARSPLVVAAASPPAVPIKFQVEYRTEFGQVLKVVGAAEVLGEWNPKQAPEMEWQDGDIWSATLPLPAGHHEFKLVIATSDASIWEGGNNRSVTVPSPATTGGSSYIAKCHWGDPEIIMKPGGPEGVATYDDGDMNEDEAASFAAPGSSQTVGKMTVEGATSADDDEEKEIGKMTVGKMTVEGGSGGKSPSISEVGKMTVGKMTVEQDDPIDSSSVVGKMTIDGGVSVINDLVDTGIGAEEGSSAAAAMTPEIALAMASGDEDQMKSPFAEAITGVLENLGLGSRDEDDDAEEDKSNQGGRSKGNKNKPSGGRLNSTGAGPSSSTFAAAAAAIMMSSTTSATVANAATPLVALPRQFFRSPPPTNPSFPFRNLSSWALPSLFAPPAQAAAQNQDDEPLPASAPIVTKDKNATVPDAATSATTFPPGQTENDPNDKVTDDDSSTLEDLKERLRRLDKVTADAQEKINDIAPPPLKGALDSAVKVAKETDVQPALKATKRALDDLQEGFSGLYSSAKEFDPATASAELKAKMEKELEARKEIEDKANAAAAEKKAADEAKLSSEELPGGAAAVVAPPAPSPPAN